MENSNECKKNFVAVYDGSSAIEDLKVMSLNNIISNQLMDQHFQRPFFPSKTLVMNSYELFHTPWCH